MRTQTILPVGDTVLILNLRPTNGRYRFRPLLPYRPLIMFLVHLAALCDVLSKIGSAPQMKLDILCDSTLQWLGELARDLRMEEYIPAL